MPESAAGLDPFLPLIRHLLDLRDSLLIYVTTYVDQSRMQLRSVAFRCVLGAVVALVGAAALMASSVLLVIGSAYGVGELCGGRTWLGQLLVGGVIVLGTSSAVWLWLRRMESADFKRMVEKYESRRCADRSDADAATAPISFDR